MSAPANVYWQQAELTAQDHARISHEILNTFGEAMLKPNSGGFVSTPPALTKAHAHATLALALAEIERRAA